MEGQAKRRDGERPGTARTREVPPPKFQMSPMTHVTKSLVKSRAALMKRACAGEGGAAKLLGIVPDTANLTDEEIAALAPPLPNSAKGIDIADIVDLRKRGLSHGAIAKVLGCTKKNVQRRLRAVGHEVDRIENFKTYRGDVLAIHQKRILDTLNPTVIGKAGLKDRVIAMGVLFDKERQITGKADNKGLQINIINYAGASQTGQITRVTISEDAEVAQVEA